MKKFMLAALAISTLASAIPATAMAAPRQDDRRVVTKRTVVVHKQDNRGPRFQTPRQRAQAYRQWRRGERFDYRQARNYRVINDYRARHLKAPPRGYRYVQSGNDAVLVGITSGLIAAVIAGAIH